MSRGYTIRSVARRGSGRSRELHDGIADGSIRNVHAPLATRTLLSSLNAVDAWYRKIDGQTTDDVDELACRVVDILIGGMTNEPDDPGSPV